MKSLSLRIQDKILEEAESILEELCLSRNAYFNEAIEFYNRYQKRRLLAEQLEKESLLVAENSMEVLRELDAMEDDINQD